MAKVSLRIYNREIEGLIEQGHTDESIAHCHHILKTFPKHLETYRLLGKAYLEAKRYDEAVDIFSRLLMSVPDDFVSHVGMSIINDERGNLDNAIWHMERAFEAQPSNPAIQGELQRLYGRRDGMEPPKVRMTRGALAHMYVQGELYPQAIAEIRAVLAQDQNRGDMQVLIANAYFKGGQKADASDMCSQLLKRYPYCFDANRIMVELLPDTAGAAESTQVYRMRVGELDPYATFAKGSVFKSDEVADAAINLERLEYKGEEVSMGAEWGSSLGIKLGQQPATPVLSSSTSSEQPDWLKGLDESQPESAPAPAAQADESIPDFLRQAGWGASTGPEQPTSFDDETEANTDANLAAADIPDWLKEQMPAEASKDTPPPPAQSVETPDWLKGLSDSQSSVPSESVEPASEQQGDVPDWLNELGSAQNAQPGATADEPTPAQPGDVPDWLSGLGGAQQPVEEPAPAQPADVPDWLKGAEPADNKPEGTPASVDSLGASADEQDDAVAWLESLAAKHGAKPEELVTDPSKRSEKAPEWVEQASSVAQTRPPSVESPSAPQQPVGVDNLGASADEQDDAVAWLESLAAKHGAKPEELVTDPSKRSEKAPEWVEQARSAAEKSQAGKPAEQSTEWSANAQNIGEQFFAEFEGSASASDETDMWLQNLDENEGKAKESAQSGEIPEWLSDTQEPATGFEESSSQKEEVDATPQAESVQGGEAQAMSQDDLADWLSGLDDETSQSANVQEGMVAEESGSDMVEEERKQPVESQAAPVSEPTEKEVPVNPKEDLPGWLQGLDENAAPAEAADEELPPWLGRDASADKEVQPKPTAPSDWHLVEEPSAAKPDLTKPAATQQQQPKEKPQQPVVVEKPVVAPPAPKASSAKKKVAKKTAGQSLPALEQAKRELDRGDIPTALEHYGKLIKKGKYLEEVIRDLRESLYRYPVEVSIWQALGDAYMRANRLKEALEAYNRAEELIR